ncbi:hypothetical protein HDK77DRAFT_504063 [Phyllosticta capitalensis]
MTLGVDYYGREVIAGMIIATLTTIFRAILAIQSIKGLLVDDQIMIVANILWWVNIALEDFAFVAYGGFNNAQLSDAVRDKLLPGGSLEPMAYSFKMGSVIFHIGWYVTITVMWCLKLSVLFFLARFAGKISAMKIHMQAVTVLWTVTFLVMMLYQSLKCVPVARNWQISPDPGDACEPALSTAGQYLINILDAIMNIAIIGVALEFLARAGSTLGKKHRLLLSGTFLVGLALFALEVVALYKLAKHDYDYMAKWKARRISVDFVISNFPSLYPNLLRGTRRLRDHLLALRPQPRQEQTSVEPTQPPQINLDIEAGFPVQPIAPQEAAADSPDHMASTANLVGSRGPRECGSRGN